MTMEPKFESIVRILVDVKTPKDFSPILLGYLRRERQLKNMVGTFTNDLTFNDEEQKTAINEMSITSRDIGCLTMAAAIKGISLIDTSLEMAKEVEDSDD